MASKSSKLLLHACYGNSFSRRTPFFFFSYKWLPSRVLKFVNVPVIHYLSFKSSLPELWLFIFGFFKKKIAKKKLNTDKKVPFNKKFFCTTKKKKIEGKEQMAAKIEVVSKFEQHRFSQKSVPLNDFSKAVQYKVNNETVSGLVDHVAHHHTFADELSNIAELDECISQADNYIHNLFCDTFFFFF
ncbi:hypothetical protein RFI_00966 [Reticulomyxa filosa]|uniref:Uncharacterized protein n=1 Tax=Reticulomyxa filosa TaxID=46433 RepID=X6PD01_RETFI|nr:hypothetical protein RFI_00966 [Reticulomyxa filosa]|eukprot:ETO36096.1 hypothetical protein RFI_00966 [Reticulomyxa filosa]